MKVGNPMQKIPLYAMLSVLSIAIYTMAVTEAFAGVDPGGVVCFMAGLAQGNFARGLATLGVIMVGVGATLGKVSWGMAILVAVGVVTLIDAPAIVVEITQNPTAGVC